MGSQTIILLIEEDDDTRPMLKRSLQADGYRVLLAVDEEDALERVGGDGHLNADLMLINLVGKLPEEVLAIGRKIRERANYDEHTPLVVMAEKYSQDLEGIDDNVGGNDWIVYLEDADQLKKLLARLTLNQ